MAAFINYFRSFIEEVVSFISFYFRFFVQTQGTSFGVKVIRLVFTKYFQYNIWGVILVFNTPSFIWKFSVTLMFLMPEGFYVVSILLFEFGLGNAIIYFVMVVLLI